MGQNVIAGSFSFRRSYSVFPMCENLTSWHYKGRILMHFFGFVLQSVGLMWPLPFHWLIELHWDWRWVSSYLTYLVHVHIQRYMVTYHGDGQEITVKGEIFTSLVTLHFL